MNSHKLKIRYVKAISGMFFIPRVINKTSMPKATLKSCLNLLEYNGLCVDVGE